MVINHRRAGRQRGGYIWINDQPLRNHRHQRTHEIKYPYSIRAICASGHCRMGKSAVSLAFTTTVDTVCFMDAISLKTDRQKERQFLRLRSPSKRPRPGFGSSRIPRCILGWRIIFGLSPQSGKSSYPTHVDRIGGGVAGVPLPRLSVVASREKRS